MDAPYRLTALEAAAGVVLGAEPLARVPSLDARTPREALEQTVRAALERPPCLVSFSGGRDSSAVLALAAHVARRESLPEPVPVTVRFSASARSVEADWQEKVVAHVGLRDWTRIEIGDELECLGPVAVRALRRHGLLWPPNAHFHVPLLEAAAGGTLLTGIGGDELLGASRWGRATAVLAGRARPEPRDALRIGLALAPTPLRRAVLRARRPLAFPWLRPSARRAVAAALARDASGEPLSRAARVAWLLRLRAFRAGVASVAVLAADAGAHVAHPLAEPAFATALARLPRFRAGHARTDAMRALVGDLLPDDVLSRSGKARFGQAAWGPRSRAFAARWSGEGADPELVDVAALRRAWPAAEHDGRLLLVLQFVWLGSGGKEPEEELERRIE